MIPGKSAEWTKKNGSLSEGNAIKEFGLDHATIVQGIREGKLQHQQCWAHGNPYFKLLRSEVEQFAQEKIGTSQIALKKAEMELKLVRQELKKLKLRTQFLVVEEARLYAIVLGAK